MKLLILGGFLGAGKTSILMPLARQITKSENTDNPKNSEDSEGGEYRACFSENSSAFEKENTVLSEFKKEKNVLSETEAQDTKVENAGIQKNKPAILAIIENEIGTVGIDQVFAQTGGYTTKELFNGCVCCSLVAPLLDTLCQLEKDLNPKWVILEATGLARPSDIADNIWDYYDENMNITTCVVVDVSRWLRISTVVGQFVYDQLENANYIFLNKTDLVDDETLAQVHADISQYTEGKIYELSMLLSPEKTEEVCREIVDEIKSWD